MVWYILWIGWVTENGHAWGGLGAVVFSSATLKAKLSSRD